PPFSYQARGNLLVVTASGLTTAYANCSALIELQVQGSGVSPAGFHTVVHNGMSASELINVSSRGTMERVYQVTPGQIYTFGARFRTASSNYYATHKENGNLAYDTDLVIKDYQAD